LMTEWQTNPSRGCDRWGCCLADGATPNDCFCVVKEMLCDSEREALSWRNISFGMAKEKL
jgi:hypothetical protein